MADSHFHDELWRVWDAFDAGHPASANAGDPVLADLIRRLHAERAALRPDASYAKQLRAHLMGRASVVETRVLDPRREPPLSPNGRTQRKLDGSGSTATRSEQTRWGWSPPLAAALLVLVVALGLVIIARGFGWWSSTEPRALIPAAAVTATPTKAASPIPGVREASLIDITIPGSALPAGIAGGAISSFTLVPGVRTTWTTPSLAMLVYVLDGDLTIRPVNQLHLKRAGSQLWQLSPGGTEITLRPGDVMYVLDLVTADYANLGAKPVEFIVWETNAGSGDDPPFPAEWVVGTYALSGSGGITYPGTAVRLRLLRIDMEPKAVRPFDAPPISQLVIGLPRNSAGEPQSVTVGASPLGSLTNVGTAATIYVIRLDSIGEPATPAASPVAASPIPVTGTPSP